MGLKWIACEQRDLKVRVTDKWAGGRGGEVDRRGTRSAAPRTNIGVDLTGCCPGLQNANAALLAWSGTARSAGDEGG